MDERASAPWKPWEQCGVEVSIDGAGHVTHVDYAEVDDPPETLCDLINRVFTTNKGYSYTACDYHWP